MVIEIDHKKIKKGKKRYWRVIALYIFLVGLRLGTELLSWIQYGVPFNIFEIVYVLLYLLVITMLAFLIRRSRRQIRTDHHLHLDEVGITSVTGHERVDIPWGDIKKISYPLRFHSPSIRRSQQKNNQLKFTLHLRPDTPYNKRKYRIYNDYEMSIYDIAEQVEDLWFVGRDKMKTTPL